MNKLDWYIGRTVFVSILAVLGVIVGLALLFAFTVGAAMLAMMVTMPARIAWAVIASARCRCPRPWWCT